jgi:hypothetical protein
VCWEFTILVLRSGIWQIYKRITASFNDFINQVTGLAKRDGVPKIKVFLGFEEYFWP